MTDPTAIGLRVLEGLRKGREVAMAQNAERAACLAEIVARADRLDRAANRNPRGRAARIARRLRSLGVTVSERHVRRILATLTGPSVSFVSNQRMRTPEVSE